MPAYRGVFEDVIGVNSSKKEMILESSYRVSVCLKRYFTDIRALSYVLISTKKTVKWLEKKIRKLFDVHGSFVLTTRGHLLPSSERLGLLNADDIVEVIPKEIESQLQKQICVEAVSNNVLDIRNENISDECDSGGNQKQKHSPETIFRQKDSSKEFELEQIAMPNKEVRQLQNKIQCVQAVVNVNNENIITDECNSDINVKQKYSSFEQKDSSKMFGLEKSVEDNTSIYSNTLNLSTDKVQVLEEMKKNALALLDSSYGICSQETHSFNSTGGTRKRKRVRKKRQQVVLSAEMPENNFEEDSFTNDLPDEDKNNSATENCKAIPLVSILHNEEVCIRKPRIVQSIVEAT